MRTFRKFDWATHGPNVLSCGAGDKDGTLEVSFYRGHPPIVFGPYCTARNYFRDTGFIHHQRWKKKENKKGGSTNG